MTPPGNNKECSYSQEPYLTPSGQELAAVTLELGNWGARWLELAPRDYDPYVVLWAWKMNVDRDRLPTSRVVVRFDLTDSPRERFWLLLQDPESELCVRDPGYDEDIVITTDSRTLTLVHLGRRDIKEAQRAGAWRVEGTPALVRAMPTWGGLYSRFANVHPVMQKRS